MELIQVKRPILGKKEIVAMYLEGLMRKRGERVKKIIELSQKRESIKTQKRREERISQ